MRGANATKNLIINPGGPGMSGIEYLNDHGEQLRSIIGEGFHLLSFDPRGVNKATPLASCYPDAAAREHFSRVRFRNLEIDSPETYAWTQNFAKACSDTMGEQAKYINTPQTAADMNTILAAVGQEDMFYWGFSYGSLLGQTYAGMFPARSKRVIIDGIVNQFKWYNGTFEMESQVDTNRVFYGFLNECFKAGPVKCPLSSIATSAEQLQYIVLSSMKKLREQPLSVYLNQTAYGLLKYENLWYDVVLPALYSPSTWFTLASHLHQIILGNATDVFLASGNKDAWDLGHEGSEFIRLNDGLSGPAYWPQDRQSLLDYMIPLLNGSMFGAIHGKIFFMRQQWNIPRTHHYMPQKGVKTAHPLLILSTTYDPVCPLVSAHPAQEAFVGSRIVRINGFGHCSTSVNSSCVAKILHNFLYDGSVPETSTECEVDSSYF
ncbi:hypothetical protein RIB2604_00500130 [Aspergillus luchuensis]|nr:hypothetical protein AKAW_11091 [Aspergillus luchuensis IFO 4308]GAT19409.1 hypothetical protein RIB2604_00500130 [Aspergillus luchuensis]